MKKPSQKILDRVKKIAAEENLQERPCGNCGGKGVCEEGDAISPTGTRILDPCPGCCGVGLEWSSGGSLPVTSPWAVLENYGSMQIRGEERGGYFHIICAECGTSTENEFLPVTERGVPTFKAICNHCGNYGVFKFYNGPMLLDESAGSMFHKT